MWPTTVMTGVNWHLRETTTASHMSVVVFGNGGTRQVAPSIFSNAILQAVDPSLLRTCSCCLALGFDLLLTISSAKLHRMKHEGRDYRKCSTVHLVEIT